MNKFLACAPTGARLLLGPLLLVFGLHGCLHFTPSPLAAGPAGSPAGGLAAWGDFSPLFAGTQLAVGLALLRHPFAALTLVAWGLRAACRPLLTAKVQA